MCARTRTYISDVTVLCCCVGSTVAVECNVWNHLKDMENTVALKYQWAESSSYDVLLRSIHVDTRNMVSADHGAAGRCQSFF